MFYNVKDIYRVLDSLEDLNQYNYSFGFSDFDAEDLVVNWDCGYEIGATKLVIIPEDLDYVIKIPFNLDTFCGDVFELRGIEEENYCEYEVKLYKMAEQEGFADFFLPIEYIGDFYGFPIYIQKKAIVFLEDKEIKTRSSNSSYQIVTKKRINNELGKFNVLPDFWIAGCLDILQSWENMRKFFYFLENKKISCDLHQRNIGFYNNKPVIIDYGGYFESNSNYYATSYQDI